MDQNILVMLVIFVTNQLILKSTIKYVKSFEHFDEPLFLKKKK